MSDKNEIVYNLAGALVAIFVGCLVVICIIVNLPNANGLDGALIANVLIGGVTLFAPIAAYYLLTDWKEQYNSKIELEYLNEILDQFRKIDQTLERHGNDIEYLYLRYLEYNDLKISNSDIEKYKEFDRKINILFKEFNLIHKNLDLESKYIDFKHSFSFSLLILESVCLMSTPEKLEEYLIKEQGYKITLPNLSIANCIKLNGEMVKYSYIKFNDLYEYLISIKVKK